MKQNIRWTLCSLFTVCSILAGCSRSESLSKQQDGELYKSMLGYYEHFKGFQTGSVNMTKSGELDSDFIFDYDICELDPIIVEYIDLYTSPDNVADWDEVEILSLVEDDSRLSAQDKERLAYIIAGGYFAQETISDDKGDSAAGLSLCPGVIDAQEYAACTAAYQKAQRRAAIKFVLGLAIAAVDPTPMGELAIALIFAEELVEIEEDYHDCLKEASEDLEEDADEYESDEQDDGSAELDTTDIDDGTEEEGTTDVDEGTEEEDMTEDEDSTGEEDVEEEIEEECEEEGGLN